MNSQLNNNGSDFKSPDEAFEYLVNQRLNEKRKKEWARELGPGPDELPDELPTENVNSKSSKTLYIRLASAAAAVVLIGSFFIFLQIPKPIDQYASNLMDETEISMTYGSDSRGANSNLEEKDIASLKNELTTVLLNQDFNQALGNFRQLEKISALSVEDKYFYAISLLKSKGENYQKAIRLLNDVVAVDDHNLKNALWLRALGYGMTDNIPLMKKDLNQLKSITNKEDKRVIDLLSKY